MIQQIVGPIGPCQTTDPLIALITTAGVVLTTLLTGFLAYRRSKADSTSGWRYRTTEVQQARMVAELRELRELYDKLSCQPSNKKGHDHRP